MNRRPLAVLAAALAASLAARAEETPPAPPPAPATPEAAAPPSGVSGDEYTVQKNDTLWDLSQKFLQNPWYWPKIWSDNPQVENPHWIYPGSKLRIRVGAGGSPTEVERSPMSAADVPVDQPQDVNASDDVAARPAPTPDVSKGTFTSGKDAAGVTLSGRIGYVAPEEVKYTDAAFVTPKELDDAGVIAGSFEEKQLLSAGDMAYVKFKAQPKLGDLFTIFRTGDQIVNPNTKEPIGVTTNVLGTLRVTDIGKDFVTGEIVKSWDSIERGDLLGPAIKVELSVRHKANAKSLTGTVLASAQGRTGTLGENGIVFLDKGSKDGVEVGNTFLVIRQSDGLDAPEGSPLAGTRYTVGDAEKTVKADLPPEDVATILVLDARESASTGLILHSIREVIVGDKIEMRPASSGSGGN